MENNRPKIFMVDDNVTNLTTGRNLLKHCFKVYPLQSAETLFKLLKKVTPDLILLDIEMPDMDGYETLKVLKADSRFSGIPVIFLTVKSDESNELLGFELGAVDYISKPFSPHLLKKRIENHLLIFNQRETIQQHANNLAELVRKKTKEVFDLQNAVLQTVADLVEFRDSFTGGHSGRTKQYMEIFLTEILSNDAYSSLTYNWDMDFILPSSQLHDVGKIAISDLILNKPGKLTAEEFKIMQSHVTVGIKAMDRIMASAPDHAFLMHAYNFVGTHHEKWNGMGYPAGLSGENIPLEGRIMAIVDVYDALVSWRPYKAPYTHEEAVKIIREGRGIHFDPGLTDIFLNIRDKFSRINEKDVDAAIEM